MRQLPSWITHYNEVTQTRLSVIFHPVSSSQPTKDADRVRSFGSFGGYNKNFNGGIWKLYLRSLNCCLGRFIFNKDFNLALSA
jgi:hypothetical protein